MRFAGSFLLVTSMSAIATFSAAHADPVVDPSKPISWSAKQGAEGMIVAVSPARQSLSIVGTTGALIGSGVDAVANDKHRKAIRGMLEGYDAGKVFEEKLAARLGVAFGASLSRVSPMGSAAGFSNPNEADKARFQAIAGEGSETLLDLRLTYGIFGVEGILVAKIEADLYGLPKGRRLWDDALVVSTEPILGANKLQDPTKRLAPNFSSPRLTADDDAIGKWTEDNGVTLRARYETAVDGAVSALLCAMGLAEEPTGEYYLGKLALNRKEFDDAATHFKKSTALDPANIDALNGLAVTMGHNDQSGEALTLLEPLTKSHPEYGAAWHNIAWIRAVKSDDAAGAKEPYRKALELGMPEDKKIEKALE